MSSIIHLSSTTQRWLRDSPLTPYVMGYFDQLIQCRYAAETTEKYMAGIAHLGLWMGQSHLAIEQLDKKAVTRFLDEHLPICACPRPVFRTRSDLRAACAHLLCILRDRGVIPRPTTPTAPLDAEVDRFDEHLRNVRGLAGETCRNYRLSCVACWRRASALRRLYSRPCNQPMSVSLSPTSWRIEQLPQTPA